MSERIAILVIHGIGQQRPYQTLDQFTRNLMKSLGKDGGAWSISPQLDSVIDPTRKSKAWIRASFVIAPPASTHAAFVSDPTAAIEDISLFEYYWAPITQDKVTYTASLLFLIRAGLRPFLYIASNLNALQSAARHRLPYIVVKEFWRQAALFVPLLLFLVFLLWSIQQISVSLLAHRFQIHAALVITVAALAIRYLYLLSVARALKTSLQTKTGWQTDRLWRLFLLLSIALHLFAWPFCFAPALTLVSSAGTYFGHIVPWLPHHLGHWSRVLAGVASQTQFDFHANLPTILVAFFLIDPRLKVYLVQAITLLLIYAVRFLLVEYIGDIAVYMNSNESSRSFAARAQIMDECTTALSSLLMERYVCGPRAGKPVYDRVLIAAHSLGSVIAYDTVSRLLNMARTADPTESSSLQPVDLVNLRGMITFGSPLNKTFYFFREIGNPGFTLRRQTLDLLYGFRLVPAVCCDPAFPPFLPNPDPRWSSAEAALSKGFRWINAYSLQDPVSGLIVFYNVERQQRFKYPPFIAHLSYWDDPDFYSFVRESIL